MKNVRKFWERYESAHGKRFYSYIFGENDIKGVRIHNWASLESLGKKHQVNDNSALGRMSHQNYCNRRLLPLNSTAFIIIW